MNWRNILTVYGKELTDMLRDRRTIISMIVVPTIVMPVLLFGVGTVIKKVTTQAQAEISTIMIVGGDDSPGVVAAITAARTDGGDRPRFRVVPFSDDYEQLVSNKRIRAAVKIPAGFEAALKRGERLAVTVYYYQGELNSGIGAGDVEKFFRDFREQTIVARLAEHQLPRDLIRPFDVERKNVAPPEKVGGATVGGIIPYMIIILCFTGAIYPAIDLTAGEKERGTMETLLCSPIGRTDIVLGKFLMVLSASLTTMLLSLVSMGVSMTLGIAYFGIGGRAQAAVQNAANAAKAAGEALPTIDPMGLVGVFAMVFPVAIMFAAVLLTVSLFAKSYKEGQSYTQPMIIVVVMPAVIGMLPGIDLNARLALVPLLNLSLVCKEMLSGVWHWHYIALIFGSSCVYAAVALALAVRMFNREDVLFRA